MTPTKMPNQMSWSGHSSLMANSVFMTAAATQYSRIQEHLGAGDALAREPKGRQVSIIDLDFGHNALLVLRTKLVGIGTQNGRQL